MIKMEKFKKVVFALIKYVTGAMLTGVLLLDIIRDKRIEYVFKNKSAIPNFAIALIFIILALIGMYFYGKKKSSKPLKSFKDAGLLPFALINLAFLLVELTVSFNIYMETGWDCLELTSMAKKVAIEGGVVGDNLYFSQHPNNVLTIFFLTLSLKITGLFGLNQGVWAYFPMVILSTILVNLSGVFTWSLTGKLTDSKAKAYIAYALFAVFVGLNPWICIPYTDTYGILFPIFILWLYETKVKDAVGVRYGIYFFVMSLAAFIGYFIKPTAFLMFIAVLVIEFVTKIASNSGVLKTFGFAVTGVILGAVLAFGINLFAKGVIGIDEDPDMKYGMPHFFFMGTNYELCGTYDQRDINFSGTFPDQKSRNSADFNAAIERLKGMGVRKFLVHIERKALVNFNDGTFSWGNEGAFYLGIRESDITLTKIIRNFYYDPEVTDYKSDFMDYETFHTIAQFIWISLLIALVYGMFVKDTKENPAVYAARLSILAIFIFVMVFEARARYLFLYAPVMVAFAVSAFKPFKKAES